MLYKPVLPGVGVNYCFKLCMILRLKGEETQHNISLIYLKY